jgi:hypothetical protein
MVLSDQRFQDRVLAFLQRGMRSRLVRLHEAAVADHIGSKNGGEPTLHGAHLSPAIVGQPSRKG